MHGQPCNQSRNVLRREEFATRLSSVGGIVGDEILVGITKQVDLAPFEVTEVETCDPFEDSSQSGVLVFNDVAEAVAGCIEIGVI